MTTIRTIIRLSEDKATNVRSSGEGGFKNSYGGGKTNYKKGTHYAIFIPFRIASNVWVSEFND